MAFRLIITVKQRVCPSFHALQKRFLYWVKPPETSIVLGTLADLLRGKSELIAENALLRVPLTILHRQIKRPVYKKTDGLLLVLLASMIRTCKQALYLVQPETLASGTLWHVLEAHIQGKLEKAEVDARDNQLDQGNGSTQPNVGSGAHSR